MTTEIQEQARALTNAQLAEALANVFGSSSLQSAHLLREARCRLELLAKIGPQQ